MKNIFLLVTIAIVLSACVNGRPQTKAISSPMCGTANGFTLSYVAYGEGKMVMIPLSKVRQGTVFVVGLKPMDGFGDADVTLTGTSANAGWISASAKHDNLPKGQYPRGAFEIGCVPSTEPVGTSYKFEVKVVKGDVTNILDPRATVVP